MKAIKPSEILRASKPGSQTCLSIYASSLKELDQQIKNVEELAKKEQDTETIDELLKPVFRFLMAYTWPEKPKTIGLFSSKNFSGVMELPFHSKSVGVISKSFHVKPLLKWLQRDRPYFLLELHDGRADLSIGSISKLQYVTSFHAPSLRNLARKVLRSIRHENYPLILAGNKAATHRMREVLKYSPIIGELDSYLKGPALEEALLRTLNPYFGEQESQRMEAYYTAKARRMTSCSLKEIASLAVSGQVKHLFINESLHIWGEVDFQTGILTYNGRQTNSRDDDILDDLAEIVRYFGGDVTVLPAEKMPDRHAAAAILKKRVPMQKKTPVETGILIPMPTAS